MERNSCKNNKIAARIRISEKVIRNYKIKQNLWKEMQNERQYEDFVKTTKYMIRSKATQIV